MSKVSIQDRKVHPPPTPDHATYTAGEVIFEEGMDGQRAFIVQSGLVEISMQTPHGETVIGYVGAGEIFGEMAPIDGQPRMATAKAVKETVCIVIAADLLKEKLEQADPFVRDLLKMLVGGLRSVTSDALNDAETQEQPPEAEEAS